jgi:hypothetical protein
MSRLSGLDALFYNTQGDARYSLASGYLMERLRRKNRVPGSSPSFASSLLSG